MSRAGTAERTSREAGFTLLEVVAVMAIIGLIVALALPRAQPGSSRAAVEQAAMRIASMLKFDRYAAMRGHATVTTAVDLDTRQVRSGASGRTLTAASDLFLKTTISPRCRSADRRVGVVFYPDGRSCGAVILLGRPGAAFEIRIDWLTGGVVVLPA